MKLFKRGNDEQHDYDLADVLQTAVTGRRLAIYDPATKLLAYWYLQLRGDEEITRARRYNRNLTLVCLWASTPAAISEMSTRMHEHLRDTDLAGYLNNGHFVIVLVETAMEGAQIVLDRALAESGPAVDGVVVSFPDDGTSFDELLESAKRRASSAA